MRSPAAYVGGYYWTIKFFPRGNCVSALSVYIECSRTPPPPVPELSEMEFKVLKGAPDAVLSDQTPEVHIAPIAGKDLISETNQTESEGQDQPGQGETTSSASAPDAESSENPEAETSGDEEDWRIPAQIGLVLYNPNETRANHTQSSAHQFNNHNPDWGWTNFHGPWDEIHKRQRCQYQALLRDDTLAFDAYIQMYEDPTQSLWWHSSSEEPVWNSYAITGYAPMGDTDLNHRAEVAALISWCHLAPFRDVVKNIDVVANMTDSKIRPRPLAFSLQKVLAWLQLERRANGSVMPEPVLRELQGQDELSGNVVDFWERLRRSLELEMGPDTNVSQQLSKIFDSQKVADDSENSVNYLPSDSNSVIRVPAKNAGSVQSAVSKYLEQRPGKWSLPEVLTVELDRQEFDKEAGRWIVDFNRVTLDEELALGKSVVDGQTGEYSLYGYVVHNGKRTSGEYYSILRPAGPGSKWLAFDDGRPNKVQCLTRKAALEGHCGLGPGEAKDPEETYHVAVIVMYIRNDVIKNYLGFKLMPIDLPSYHVYALAHNVSMMLAPEDSIQQQCDNRGKANVPVEVYSSPNLDLLHSLFDGYDLMSCARSNGSVRCLSVPSGTSYNDLREKLALWDSPNNRDTIDRIRFWYICRSPDQGWLHEDNLIHISNIYDGISVIFPGDVVRLWMDVVSEDEAHLFSIPHRVESSDVFERQSEQVTPTPAPVQVSEAEVDGETNAEQSGSGNSETIPPERPETPRASGNEPRVVEDADIPMQDGDGSEVVPSAAMTADAVGDGNTQAVEPVVEPVVEQAAEPPAEPEASNPGLEEQQTNGDVAMQDVVDNDAAIAAVIANDLEEFESSQAMQAEPTPPPEIPVVPVPEPLSVPQNNDELPPQPEPEEPMREEPADQENATLNREENAMDVTEDILAADENEAPINAPEPLKFEPPVGHVYYFLQIFDAHKQEFRFAGRYFAREEDSVKETICHVLKWPEDKEFLVWARFQNDMRSVDTSRSMARAAGGQGFGCFVVKERLSDTEYVPIHFHIAIFYYYIFTNSSVRISKLTKECLFEAPRALARYLWASSRGHPTDAFTGTKVIDDSITGDHYSGELVKGFYHGKGTHISDAGIVYTGDFVQGYREGQGRMEYPSGDTYEGDWLENQRHGQGTFIERRTGNKYVGGYREGKRHGKGISYWEVADEEMDLCQICYGEDQDALFYDCGHVCACVTCAKQVDICPMCRKNVINVVRIYKT